MSFVKLDTAILNSSIWDARDTRSIFITALVMAKPRELKEPMPQLEVRSLTETGWVVPPGWYGFVEAAGTGIIRRDGCDLEEGYKALEELGAPDPDSRSQAFEGRRLVRVDGGYVVLNYIPYRDKDHSSTARVRKFRKRQRANETHGTSCNVTKRVSALQGVTGTQAEAEAEVETTKTPSARSRSGEQPAFSLAPYIDAHREFFPNSDPPGGRYGRGFKKLEAKHGKDETLRRFRNCLARKGSFASPEHLASFWSDYDQGAAPDSLEARVAALHAQQAIDDVENEAWLQKRRQGRERAS